MRRAFLRTLGIPPGSYRDRFRRVATQPQLAKAARHTARENNMDKQKVVGILVFNDVEVLDFCGPFEVFSVTRLNEERRRQEASPFSVFLIAEKKDPIITSGGMRVLADYDLDDSPRLDILVVPGGWGTRTEMNNQRLVEWISKRSKHLETLASVCTGSLLLGKAGLLNGKRATTH